MRRPQDNGQWEVQYCACQAIDLINVNTTTLTGAQFK